MEINWRYILFWIFTIIVLIMLFDRAFGSSPTDFGIFVGILGIFFSGMMDLYYRAGGVKVELKEFKNEMKDFKIKTINSFKKIGNDVKEIKEKF